MKLSEGIIHDFLFDLIRFGPSIVPILFAAERSFRFQLRSYRVIVPFTYYVYLE